MTYGFTQWLSGFAGENSAIGDLARDVAKDPGWPDDTQEPWPGEEGPEMYIEHLQDLGLDDDAPAMRALMEAVESYTINHGPEAGHRDPR